MALAVGKLTILIGAGLVGSVLAKEGRMPGVSDVFSGAYKVFFKQLRNEDTKSSSAKPRSDALLAQVNSLREELQLLASNRPMTIITSTGSGSNKYGIMVVVVVVGYGYVWWKGWRLPMFATKRSLFDACNTVAKQLENVHSSIWKTKRHLSSKLDSVDVKVDESAATTAATLEEASELRGEVVGKAADVQSVHQAVQTLVTKVIRFEGKQDKTTEGVLKLLNVANSIERIQASPSSSSKPALEMPPVTPSRTASLPPILPPEPQSPSGLKEIYGTLEPPELLSTPTASKGVHMTERTSSGNSGLFGGRFSSFTTSILTRTRSAAQPSK